MMSSLTGFNNPPAHRQDGQTSGKQGILLINTGTPDSYQPEDIKRYLEEFLSDRNLIDVPPFIWRIILHAFILPRRPYVTSKRYQDIWTPEGAPLLVYMRSIRDKLQHRLDAIYQQQLKESSSNPAQNAHDARRDAPYIVEYASRYGNPSIETVFKRLANEGCTRVLSIPLFPQTSFSTTKTCAEKVREAAAAFSQIQHKCLTGYANSRYYVEAIAHSIKAYWNYEPGSKLLFAFHSVPLKHIHRGDTYVAEIEKSMRAVAETLGIPRNDWEVAFQSRFEDSRKWVGPNTYTVLQVWAQEKVTRVAVIAPGFAVDCLETIYDCNTAERQFFENACSDEGTEGDFTYIPCLNDSDLFIDLLANLATSY